MPPEAPVTVEQVDRIEALPFIPRNSIAGQDRDGILAGKYDECAAIQAFARQRLAERDKLRSLLFESLYHLRLDDAAQAYHNKVRDLLGEKEGSHD